VLVRLSKPSPAALDTALERACSSEPTYREVGATASATLPAGYRHDLYEAPLGSGETTFGQAADALRSWRAHVGAGVDVVPAGPVADGASVILMLRLAGFWTIAPCRILYVVDEESRAGFAYGTLPGHPEIGEAAFTVEREGGACLFRIRSFSRPASLIARAGAPVIRRIQREVNHGYLAALARAAVGG
jgi:uncharacterized protein (UPF0548 family)